MKFRIFAAAIAIAATMTAVQADTRNKKNRLKFSGPVTVPNAHSKEGVTTLPAGTYVFRLLDSQSSRHIVEVTNPQENHVYSTILAVPDYRVNASSKTVMYFSESAAGSAPPVKAWFYPGDNYGQRFVYPKKKAAEIAVAVNQPVPAAEIKVIEKTKIVEVPVYIETPAKQETAYAPATFDKHDATDTAGVDGEAVPAAAPAPEPKPAKLPKTGSPMPLIGLLGLGFMAGSQVLRRLGSRVG
jgi:LPXTG-motif cell wall-anchored protein